MEDVRRRGWWLAFGAALGIVGWAIPWKLAAAEGEAQTNALLLLTFAASWNGLFNQAQHRLRGVPRRGLSRFDWGLAVALAALTLLGNVANAHAIRGLSPALLTLAMRGEVILVALMAWPLIGERPDRAFWLGAAVAAGGLLILQDPFDGADARALGLAWAGVAVLAFGSMAVLTRRFIHQVDPWRVNALRLWLSVGLWFAWYGVPPSLWEVTPAQAGFTALAAFSGPFIGRLCLMTSARYLEARLSILATLAAPPLTLLVSLLLLADTPTPREMLGGLVMLVGIAIPVWGGRRSAPPPDAATPTSPAP